MPDISVALNQALTDSGLSVVDEDQVRQWIGNGAAKLVERALQSICDETDWSRFYEPVLAQFFVFYEKHLAVHTTLYPGVLPTLESLLDRGFKLSLCTNKPSQFTLPLIEQLKLARYFNWILSGDSLAHKKPHPEPLLNLCDKQKLSVSQSVMIGDSTNDVQAAVNAGMRVVCFDYGYNHGEPIRQVYSGPVLSNFPELLGWLESQDCPACC